MARNRNPIPRGTSRKGTQRSSTGKTRPRSDQIGWRVKLQQSRLKFDDDQKQIFLQELALHGLKGRASEAAGVCPNTVSKHIKNDPEFEAAVNESVESYRDKFVDHAMTLAYDGIEVKKYNKDGDLVEERRDYPIPLILAELKRVEPGYRDKQTIDLNARGGVLVVPEAVDPNNPDFPVEIESPDDEAGA